jgi:hypothetical protein
MSNDIKPGFWVWQPKEPVTSGEWLQFTDGWLSASRGQPLMLATGEFWTAGWLAWFKAQLSPQNDQTSFALS